MPTRRDWRWASGLVLLVYVLLHLANHAAGLVSLAAAERMLGALHAAWRSPPGTLLLYGATAVHVGLALLGLWERHTLRMPAVEALRLLLGLAMPWLLLSHFASTRWAWESFGIDLSYARVVAALWSPPDAALQLGLMAAAWGHGCIGLHLALRRHAGWRRARWLWTLAMVLVPLLAALGFLAMGREIAWSGAQPLNRATPEQAAAGAARIDALRGWYAALVASVLLARAARGGLRRRGQAVTLAYGGQPAGRNVQVPRGWTVLEASRAHGIDHVSLCGGRARCSTCRVRVHGPPAHLPPPGPDERRTLARVSAPADVRLACQLRPLGDLKVTPLFAAASGTATASHLGREREVAILFVDLRRWSHLADGQWPVDLVYVLDRYFALVGGAVRDSAGVPNQFIGDSVMAIFGLDCGLPQACRQALRCAALIEARMDEWRAEFGQQFGHALDFGMGLHAGSAAIGEVGYLETTTFTAVGEVVNTASRLQDHSKVSRARLVVSRHAVDQAGIEADLGRPERLRVRGRHQPLDVFAVPHPARLPPAWLAG